MKILLLGAGDPQVQFIHYLHKYGHEVCLLTYDKDPIAKKYADKFFQISTLDVEKVVEVAETEHVDRVIAVCTDQALYTMCAVSERLGLPCYMNLEQAEICTKKDSMKCFLDKAGIRNAKYVTVSDINDLNKDMIELPIVVKPVDCNSSKGVKKVLDKGDIDLCLKNAINYSRTGKAIVEEYIKGRELTIDGFVNNGKFTLLLISEVKKMSADSGCLIAGCETLHSNDEIRERVTIMCQKIVDSLGLVKAPFIAQMIERNDELYVLEFSARTGGGEKYRVIEDASNVDVLFQTMNLVVGNEVIVEPHYSKDIFGTQFLYGKKGIIESISGFEELKERETVSSYYIYKEAGAEIKGEIKSSGDRIAGFTVRGNNRAEIDKKMKKAIESINVVDVYGKSMIVI
ncbi:Phosphoribosylamine-glycine ligase [Lachnospiraceae bacterium]|nr:Phosphoribosylamine-glycine ligase [Lachnospiraceae bacterium]